MKRFEDAFRTFTACALSDFVNCWFKSEGHCQNPRHNPRNRQQSVRPA